MFIQIIISKTKQGISKSTVVALTMKMADWLKLQPGFINYECFENNNSWADTISWSSKEAALSGLSGFQATEIGKEMMSFLEPDLKVFMGTPIDLNSEIGLVA